MTIPPGLRDLLTPLDGAGEPIDSPARWQAKRAHLEELILDVLGAPPYGEVPAPEMRVYRSVEEVHYRHLYIGYEASPGEEVRAHLLIPHVKRRKDGAAVLCLHGTSVEAKDTQIGAGSKPGRDYGRLLAVHGFVTLSPDHLASGERQAPGLRPYDTSAFYERHPEWSAVGKAIWDGRRALDVLARVPEVNQNRIGAVGHSLGGHGSLFVAAFDERIKAAVSSCGVTTWTGNPKRLNWARDSWYQYIPALRPIFLAQEEPPFDLHEFASLIAPRAFLNISGLSDESYGNNHTLGEFGSQLFSLYRLLGNPEAFANFLFGGGHDIPNYSRALTVAWFERWLLDTR